MNTPQPQFSPEPPSSVWQRSTTRRLLGWLFSRQTLRRLLFICVALVTLVALLYGITNWRAARAWNNYQRQLAAQGEKIDWKALIPPPVPDDQNFTMTPFLAPLFDFRPNRQPGESHWRDTNAVNRLFQFADNMPGRNGLWERGARHNFGVWIAEYLKHQTNVPSNLLTLTNKEADRVTAARAVLTALQEYEPVLEELRRASTRPYAQFNINYSEENPFAILLPHLRVIKMTCRLVDIRATAALALGQTESAFADIKLLIVLADSLKQEPLLISQLVRWACLNMGLGVFSEGSADHRWSEAQLKELQAHFQSVDFLSDYARTLRAERGAGCTTIEWLQNAPYPAQLMSDLVGHNESEREYMGIRNVLLRLAPRGWFDWEQLNYARTFQESILPTVNVQTRQFNPAHNELAQKELKKSFATPPAANIWEHRFFSRMLLPALENSHRRMAYGQSLVDQATVVCALERYKLAQGQYPDQLAALAPEWIAKLPHDVIGGQPLKYQRTDDQFTLYSVGWNQEDDGGTLEFTSSGKHIELASGDWVWPSTPQ